MRASLRLALSSRAEKETKNKIKKPRGKMEESGEREKDSGASDWESERERNEMKVEKSSIPR